LKKKALYKFFLIFMMAPAFLLAQPDAARQQIKDLKGGTLLVRLMTSEKKIKALQDAGYPDKAEAAKAEQAEINKGIAEAFQENFNFCRVFFFYSYASEEVKQLQFKGNLLGYDLKPVAVVDPPVVSFFVAEFGDLQQTDEKYRENESFRETDSGGKEAQTTYYGSPDMGLPALLIRDRNFVQLRDPFPYYVRTFESLSPVKRTAEKSVKKLNGKLQDYYQSTSK
jgi:hypothetical protein